MGGAEKGCEHWTPTAIMWVSSALLGLPHWRIPCGWGCRDVGIPRDRSQALRHCSEAHRQALTRPLGQPRRLDTRKTVDGGLLRVGGLPRAKGLKPAETGGRQGFLGSTTQGRQREKLGETIGVLRFSRAFLF